MLLIKKETDVGLMRKRKKKAGPTSSSHSHATKKPKIERKNSGVGL